jgi:hypothetical protein
MHDLAADKVCCQAAKQVAFSGSKIAVFTHPPQVNHTKYRKPQQEKKTPPNRKQRSGL